MKMASMNEITGPHNLYHDNASVSKKKEWMLQSCGKHRSGGYSHVGKIGGSKSQTPGFSNGSRFGQATFVKFLEEPTLFFGGSKSQTPGFSNGS